MIFIPQKRELGKIGENTAVKFLKRKRYEIIERNYRCPLGEIDIVARDKKTLVFVEVKTRSSTNFGLPEEAISYRKKQHLSRIASFYLIYYKIKEADCRFDVVSILMDKDEIEDIHLIKNAFEAV
ncbi:MAG: YraN family protein [Candidatus Aerophobetes bacterium]|nr:YraN family protein [Candidatus Aerophobetes bacterium]